MNGPPPLPPVAKRRLEDDGGWDTVDQVHHILGAKALQGVDLRLVAEEIVALVKVRTARALSTEPTIEDVPESQRDRVCLCAVADGRVHLRGRDCDAQAGER